MRYLAVDKDRLGAKVAMDELDVVVQELETLRDLEQSLLDLCDRRIKKVGVRLTGNDTVADDVTSRSLSW